MTGEHRQERGFEGLLCSSLLRSSGPNHHATHRPHYPTPSLLCLSDKASPACSQVHRLRMVAAIHLTTDSVTSASMPHAILPGPVPPVLSLSYFQVLYLLVYLTSGCRTCLYTQGCHQLADLCWLSISDSSHFKIFIQSTNAGA